MSGEGTKEMSEGDKKLISSNYAIEFTKDGTLIVNSMGETKKLGTYSIDDSGTTLILNYTAESVKESKSIIELAAGKLVIRDTQYKIDMNFKGN